MIFLMQGMGGLMSLTGEKDGQPMKVGVAVTDVFTGMYAATAILAAVAERERSGLGQHIDIALFDVQIATLANQIQSYLVSGEAPARAGNAHPSIVPYQVFATEDGHVILAAGNDAQFRRFAEAAGAPGLAADPRFATNPMRVTHREVLVPLLEVLMRGKPSQDWIALLEEAGVPCGPINRLSDLETPTNKCARGAFLKPSRIPRRGECAAWRARCVFRAASWRMSAHRLYSGPIPRRYCGRCWGRARQKLRLGGGRPSIDKWPLF